MKNPHDNARSIGDSGLIPGQEDPLEKEMATHSRILAWEISWAEELDGLQSMGVGPLMDRNLVVRSR